MDAHAISRLAVIGAGQMGGGIAEVAAARGITVALCDTSVERAEIGRAALVNRLKRLVEKGKLVADAARGIEERVRAMPLEAAVDDAHAVIEAASEDRAIKEALFQRVDALAKSAVLLASNTSSLSITRLAGATTRPGRVIGMHFMNPVPRMQLVELVTGIRTEPATLELVRAFAARLDKVVIVSQDRPGFLVNRMLLPFINEACFALQEGVGSAEDIDTGARLGLNHPLGPLELADLIGLDTVLAIAEVLHHEIGEDKYRPATLLRNLVAAGFLGRKSGQGFYRYDPRGERLPGPSQERP